MSKLVIKTDHKHINETAEYYFQNGYNALANLHEVFDINIGYWRKKIFYALLREVIIASGIDNNITSANEKAKYIVDSYGNYSGLLIFMDKYIKSDRFRTDLCQGLRFYDKGEVVHGELMVIYNKERVSGGRLRSLSEYSSREYKGVVDYLKYNCVKKAESPVIDLGNEHTKDLYKTRPKKAELALILNSLVPFMVEVYKMKLRTSSNYVFTRHINGILDDFNLGVITGKSNIIYTSKEDKMGYDGHVEAILTDIVAVKHVLNCDYDKFRKNKVKMGYNIKWLINDMSTYVSSVISGAAIYDIGLESLVNFY